MSVRLSKFGHVFYRSENGVWLVDHVPPAYIDFWFVIDLESRRVHIAGMVRHPHDAWIQQIARNLTDSVDGFLRSKRYLIHDRDPLFTAAVPRDPPRRWRQLPQAPTPEPQSEFLRGKVRALPQIRVPRQARSAR